MMLDQVEYKNRSFFRWDNRLSSPRRISLGSQNPNNSRFFPLQPMNETGTLLRGIFQRRQSRPDTIVKIPESTMFRTLPVLLLGDATPFLDLGALPIGSVMSILFLITVIVTIGTVLYKERKTSIEARQVAFFFWLELAYMALLIALGAVYMTCWPPNDKDVNLIGGIVPFAIPWFGALGAVLIGLEGVFMHNKNWDSKYNYWHIARPLIGAVLGFVAFFIMVLVIKSSGASPTFLTPQDPKFTSTDLVLFYVLAFLVGYREETFRELIKRATDLILAPSTSAPSAAPAPQVVFLVNGQAETSFDLGGTPVNTANSKQIVVQNSGTADLENAEATITHESPGSDIFRLATNPLPGAGILPRSGSQTLVVEFKPKATGSFSATLTVKGKNMTSQTFTLKGQGTS
jgi:hypothetical protein